MPFLHRSFPQNSPILSGKFAERDLRVMVSCGSSPLCTRGLLLVLLLLYYYDQSFHYNRMILRVRMIKSSVRTLYQNFALTSVRSQNDWKVPRKLIHVTIISISTKNRISKSVYSNLLLLVYSSSLLLLTWLGHTTTTASTTNSTA